MNVTNRRKSTDADTTPTQTSHHHSQHQPQQHPQPLLAYVSCRQAATASSSHHNRSTRQEVEEDEEEDQEQVVTSTSTDCLLPLQAEGEGEEVTIDLDAADVVTSPARITSSTNNYDILTYSSADSLSLEEEMVMPTTSENAARLEREDTTSSSSPLLRSISNNSRTTRASTSTSNEMVARDTTHTTVADAAAGTTGSGGDVSIRDHLNDQTASTSNNSDSPKIILKLPKPTVAACESQSANEDDLRKVEPLKINLHNTHHHHNTHHTPKITIKPILKDPITDASLASSEECSSSAEDDMMVAKLHNSEPHIVPKLTIRAKNEDYGSSHTSVVPKLTIKINDSTATDSSTAAANTPPLPKLTIKTGQDGHSESIITNISPASSTTSSSSSLASSSASSLTSGNSLMATASSSATVPKLTIKPIQKAQDTADGHQLPSIPKLCIKTNTLSTDVGEEAPTASKIPKLTIKTGQEHAVIITQHNDHAKLSGGIPKLTIKTKSMEVTDDSNVSETMVVGEKIPKLTIKTSNTSETIPKLCINKAQLEAASSSNASPLLVLSPKQPAVPKLTISRQVAQAERVTDGGVEGGGTNVNSIPKMTIKTQSGNKLESVPKLTLKPIVKRPSSTEESGISDDPEEEDEEEVVMVVETNKTVPKLTIKNVGSPQQKLKIVVDTAKATAVDTETSKIAIPPPSKPPPPPPPPALVSEEISNSNEDADEFSDLLNVDNVGGESSNSQEFCGFNEAIAADKQVMIVTTSITTSAEDVEFRRQSDDMDIDESLQIQHEPQMFQNASHFEQQISPQIDSELNGNVALNSFPSHIIDTVDLTSSAGSSPAHRFDYSEDVEGMMEDDKLEETIGASNNNMPPTTTNILLECLQRETSVIQNTQQLKLHTDSISIPPPLQPKPPLGSSQNTATTATKYPELMERLMANGSLSGDTTPQYTQPPPANQSVAAAEENIIDSIEILDTPEGSPRNSLDERPEQIKSLSEKTLPPNGLHYPKDGLEMSAFNNNNSNLKRHAANAPLANKNLAAHLNFASLETNLEELPSKLRKIQHDNIAMLQNNSDINAATKVLGSHFAIEQQQYNKKVTATATPTTPASLTNHQRSRKQKHEHLLPLPMDEVIESSIQTHDGSENVQLRSEIVTNNAIENSTPLVVNKRKGGRPRKSEALPTLNAKEDTTTATPVTPAADHKSRRVQLLRKRLAIDMVDAEQPLTLIDELGGSESVAVVVEASKNDQEEVVVETPKRERNLRAPLRTSRRSNTPTPVQTEAKAATKSSIKPISFLAMENNKKALIKHQTAGTESVLNHFLESNSSVSSACSTNSSTITSTMAISSGIVANSSNSVSLSMATQIDLTMSSSSSNSNGSTTNTVTTVEATTLSRQQQSATNASGSCGIVMAGGGGSNNNSMLPPTTILSSSDPLPDVIFRPNDFSSIIATQQLRGTTTTAAVGITTSDQTSSGFNESQDEDMPDDASGADCSEDDSASSSSMSATPGRGGRSRGRSGRGGVRAATGRAYRPHRLGRGASAVAKAIAVNRPRWVGALKHTPDPERIKGLYSPSPQVFEEDTRMSADLTQTSLPQDPAPATPTRQPDFLNNEESQSSVISNTSILDPNNILAIQNGSAVKKTIRKKKMEVCVAEEEFTVASIAEYDWPRPKGCCPSKNRDTFMIQEQVAMYLGIKSFKRKYPDLPRRQVDMEERNWLQEQGLVSEKMCDLGITAVWASDILDIMYTDFYEKYEEYKDYVRQKHLREIEAKQKSLGLNVAGRGLQARERAMLNASKWNSYFNKTRKEERLSCLDLQTLVVNKPSPATAPISTIPNRPVAEAVALAAKAERIPQPPTLLKPRVWEPIRMRDVYYPLSLVPGQFCEKYYNYSPAELRRFPLNTVIDHHHSVWQPSEDDSNSSDTDSAVESIDNDTEAVASIKSASKLLRKRRVRRARNKLSLSNDEFKIPPIPGASTSATSSTDSSTSSDDSSTDNESESSCSSSSSEDPSEDENSPATCGVCLRPQNRNLKEIPELFVQCYTCRRKVHPSCIEMPHRMATRVRNYNWQCAECKCCIKCKRKTDQNKMLFCEQCDRGFHIYCTGTKAVPDGRWSCDRCSICMRCGATKPEGLPMFQQPLLSSPNGERVKHVRQRKLKWVNEYRVDHVTKIKEHYSMMCVPCGRMKTTKRVQIATHHNTVNTYMTSPGSGGAVSPNCSSGQSSPCASMATPISNPAGASLTVTPTVSPSMQNCSISTAAITEAINVNSAAETSTSPFVAVNLLDNKVSSSPSSSNLSTDSSTTSTTANTAASTTTTTTTASPASVTTGGGPPPVVA